MSGINSQCTPRASARNRKRNSAEAFGNGSPHSEPGVMEETLGDISMPTQSDMTEEIQDISMRTRSDLTGEILGDISMSTQPQSIEETLGNNSSIQSELLPMDFEFHDQPSVTPGKGAGDKTQQLTLQAQQGLLEKRLGEMSSRLKQVEERLNLLAMQAEGLGPTHTITSSQHRETKQHARSDCGIELGVTGESARHKTHRLEEMFKEAEETLKQDVEKWKQTLQMHNDTIEKRLNEFIQEDLKGHLLKRPLQALTMRWTGGDGRGAPDAATK